MIAHHKGLVLLDQVLDTNQILSWGGGGGAEKDKQKKRQSLHTSMSKSTHLCSLMQLKVLSL